MPDRFQFEVLRAAQPRCRLVNGGREIADLLGREGLVDRKSSIGRRCAQAWPRADPVNLALDQAL